MNGPTSLWMFLADITIVYMIYMVDNYIYIYINNGSQTIMILINIHECYSYIYHKP